MILTLEVIGPQASILGEAARKTFVAAGGTIGRSTENDWVIPDSYISGTHARIHFRNDRFFIVDSSANGTSLKARANRLTKGQWYALSDMDRLFLDTVEVRVHVDNPAEKITAPIAVEPPAAVAAGAGKQTARDADAQYPPLRTTPLAMPTDAVLAVLLGDRDVSSYEREFLNMPLPSEEIFSQAIERASAAADGGRAYDRTTAMTPGDSPAPADPAVPRTVALNPGGATPADSRPAPTAPAPQHFRNNETAQHPAVAIDTEYAAIFDDAPPAAPQHAAAGALLDTMRVKSLLSGAGIPSESVTPELTDTLTHILQVCIQGLLELQQQRETMKDAFRLSVTKFKQAENNPLRFSANVEDALYNLLVKRNPAYLQPAEAVTSSFKDAQSHQTAILKAMHAAFFHMMTQFDPQQFAADDSKKRSLFGSAKQAPWEQYSKHYAELRKQSDGGFSTLFGAAFARAYQEELDRLRQSG